MENTDILKSLDYLKMAIQEHEAHGINKGIIIDIKAYGQSEIRVQGINESWVLGTAERLFSFLKQRENILITTYKKFGLSLNQAVFIALLVVMPSINTWENRLTFAICVFILLTFLFWLHSKVIPSTKIKLEEKPPSWIGRNWPSIVSWIAGIIGTVMASFIFYWLTK